MTEPGSARSALNLRAALAVFGLVVCTALGIVALVLGNALVAGVLFAGAVVAVVDLVVIGRRRGREPGEHTTLFE
ncbi:MAG: DUF6343 family protein [Mycobacteriales bacterium]